MRRRRRPPILAVALAALTLGACGRLPLPPEARPIIILDLDTLRADRLGCYGNPRPTSPQIDALAAESYRFTRAYAQAPNTQPSQTSIFTSLYPSSHGSIRHEDRLSDEVVTLAEVLRDVGYRTAAFVDGGYMNPAFGLAQGFQGYHNSRTKGLAQSGPQILSWLRRHADETFFLLIHTYDVHTPYAPEEPYRSLFTEGLAPTTPGFDPVPKRMNGLLRASQNGRRNRLSEEDVAYMIGRYDGGIRFVDDWVGQLLAVLDETGLLDRAWLVLLSDHGEEFMEHGSVLHDKLYSTVTHVPLLIRPPGGTPTGERPATIDTVVEMVDVMPTVLESVGAPTPAGIQGRTLGPLMRAEATVPPRDARAFSESPFYGGRRSVVAEGHRLLLTLDNRRLELYDLTRDPLEQQNLARRRPQRTRSLRNRLREWQTMLDAGPRFGQRARPDDHLLDQLRALGYLDG